MVAVCSLALTLLAIVDLWHNQVPSPAGRLLRASQLSSISHLTMVDGGGNVVAIKKGQGGIWLSSDVKAGPVDADAVRELVSVLALLRSVRESPRNPESGLGDAAPEVKIGSAEGELVLAIGATTGDGRHRWVGVDGRGPAYLVENHLIVEILDLRGRLLSRSLLPSRSDQDQRLSLRGPSGWLMAENGQVTWQGLEGLGVAVSAEGDVQLRGALADLEFEDPTAQGPNCPAGSPVLLVEFGSEKFEIQECEPCSSDRIGLSIGSRSGCTAAATWQTIQEFLASPTQLMETGLLPTRDVRGPVRVVCGERELAIDPSDADAQRLREWWRRLDGLGRSVSVGSPPPTLCTLRGDNYELHFGQIDKTWQAHYAQSPAAQNVLLRAVAPEIRDLLHVEASRFMSRDLISEEALNVTRVSLAEGAQETVLERGELAFAWRSPGGELSELDASELALSLVAVLSTLRADDFVSPDERIVPSPNSGRRLAIDYATPTDSESRHHDVWVVARPKSSDQTRSCWAQVDAWPPAWLAKETCQVLLTKLP